MPALPSAPERLIGTSATLRDHDHTRVLLIAPSNHGTETLVELLEALGYQVQAVPTGGMARVQTPPEVLLTDVCLPDGDAWEVLQSLRRQPGWAGVPAIALGRFEPAQAEYAAAFTEVLAKPLSIWALHRAVQNALQLKQVQAHTTTRRSFAA